MSWFDKLTSFIKVDSVSDAGIKILSGNTVNVNHITIDARSLSKEQIPKLKEILTEGLEATKESDYIAASSSVSHKLELIENFEKGNFYPKSRKFILSNIPVKDQAIWLSALLIRKHFEEGNSEVVARLKQDIMTRFPGKGGNIANLCTAGYLENHIIPLHTYVVTELGDEAKFHEIYDTIVNELPYAVFSSFHKSEDDLKSEILNKIHEVGKYGWKKVSVHGIGEDNVRKIKRIMVAVEEESPEVLNTEIEANNRIIKVTFNLNTP